MDFKQKTKEAIPFIDELITKANCGVLLTIEKAEVIKYTPGK